MTTKKASPGFIAVIVSIATFMEVLDTTIVNVSLNAIGGSLSATQHESTWVLTSYLIANGIVLSLSGWFADLLGRKNYFMVSIAAFTLASLACGLATSLSALILFRLLQGIAGGGLQPMQMSIMMDEFPAEKRGTAFAISGMTMVVAPILGPTLGGWITDHFDWRWIFFINVPVGALSLALTKKWLEDHPHTQAKGLKKIDYLGLTLVVIGLGLLQVIMDKGEQEDWFDSQFIMVCSAISATTLIASCLWLSRRSDPIVDIDLLSIKSFRMSCIMMFFLGFALYGSSTLLPLMVQSLFGYDATLSGLVLSPGALSIVLLMPLIGRFATRFQTRYLVMLGMTVLGTGLWMTALITPETDFRTFVWLRTLQVLGLPFLFIPCGTLAFSEIPKEKSGKASALYSLIRNLGGSIGISLLLSYSSQKQQSYQYDLASHMTVSNPGYTQYLSKMTYYFTDLGHSIQDASYLASMKIYSQLVEQSMMLAYCSTFKIMALGSFLMAIIALWIPNNPLRTKTDMAIH